jgi:protein tyrosine phosphatase
MFLDRQKQTKNPKYILVHCIHGHNRTGFMIVHYLMRRHVSCITEVGQQDSECYFILFSSTYFPDLNFS